jgi:predicted AAA+ superfamily ATPase
MQISLDFYAIRCYIVDMERFQETAIRRDLEKKMVFLCGPRQVGKTWLAKKVASGFTKSIYLNYDRLEDRTIMLREGWRKDTELLVLDEVHKMADWKNFVKGIFDTREPHLKILVTGSSRLEMFRQMGDSLAGRFFRHRLLPFSPAELSKTSVYNSDTMDRLLLRGGFPEPFLTGETIDVDRWRMQYADGLIRTDVLDFERIHDFRAIQLVLELLRRRVGSPVSYSSIAEDAQISPNTVKKYIELFEGLYVVFRVTPFSKNIARSLLKEPKIYFYDNGMVIGDEGAQFENMTAVNLLKHVYGLQDYKGEQWQLQYLRNKDGDEVDFCLVKDDTAEQMIEVKVADSTIPPALRKFRKRHDIRASLVVKELKREQEIDGVSIEEAVRFFGELFL